MTEPKKQYAYFTITDWCDPAASCRAKSFDPDRITERLSLAPTEAWRKGDVDPRTNLERKFSRWSLRSKLADVEPLEAHIADVLAQLDLKSEGFVSVAKEYGGCMQLVGYFYEGYPGLHFDAKLVEGLARYGLCVDFDFYYLWSDSHEDT